MNGQEKDLNKEHMIGYIIMHIKNNMENLSLNILDIVFLFTAFISIILAFVAISLSILFYVWSDKANRDTQRIAYGIESNTKKIESIFDKLYSDTFKLMKSNVEAIQNKFLDVPISSGDSSQTEQEQLETILISIMMKVKVNTREAIYHYINSTYPYKKYSFEQINDTIDILQGNGLLYINESLISISNQQKPQEGEGKVSEQSNSN
jgi:hypothetical protein